MVHLAHRKADFGGDGALESHYELGVAAKFLFRVFGLQSRRIKYPMQWIDFAVANTRDLQRRPMLPMQFAAWFFQNFLLEATMEFTCALPRKFFYQDQLPVSPVTQKEQQRTRAKESFDQLQSIIDMPAGQSRDGPPKHHALIRELFSRYDFDESGDLNSPEELTQLTPALTLTLTLIGGTHAADYERALQALVRQRLESNWLSSLHPGNPNPNPNPNPNWLTPRRRSSGSSRRHRSCRTRTVGASRSTSSGSMPPFLMKSPKWAPTARCRPASGRSCAPRAWAGAPAHGAGTCVRARRH